MLHILAVNDITRGSALVALNFSQCLKLLTSLLIKKMSSCKFFAAKDEKFGKSFHSSVSLSSISVRICIQEWLTATLDRQTEFSYNKKNAMVGRLMWNKSCTNVNCFQLCKVYSKYWVPLSWAKLLKQFQSYRFRQIVYLDKSESPHVPLNLICRWHQLN